MEPAELDGYLLAIQNSHARIRPFVEQTPLVRSKVYSDLVGAEVYLKKENQQRTGSFKLRGAFNKCACLSVDPAITGVVTASTGNHGAAVAMSARHFGWTTTIFAPNNVDQAKLKRVRELDAMVRLVGDDGLEAELAAAQFAKESDQVYISPYNDPVVIAGQGTIGWEISQQLDQVDYLFGSLGGGGMLSGIGIAMRKCFPKCRTIAGSPANSDIMIQSLAAGRILQRPSLETLSDGTAGGVESNAITFPILQQVLDGTLSVTEQEIADELIRYHNGESDRIEGAAAVSLAAMRRMKHELATKTVVVVLCGGNISEEKLASISKPNTG